MTTWPTYKTPKPCNSNGYAHGTKDVTLAPREERIDVFGKTAKVLLIAAVLLVITSSVAFAAVRGGTKGNDTLNGTDKNDAMYGVAGNDNINGLAGNDEITGFTGNDNLKGGPGNDTLIGGPGTDSFNTGGTTTPPGTSQQDYVHAYDDTAETICVPDTAGAFEIYFDEAYDTIVGGSSCSQILYSPNSSVQTAAASEEVTSGKGKSISNEDL